MKYTHKQMMYKSKYGMDKELRDGLTIAAVFFYQSLGIPLEIFNHWITTRLKNRSEQLMWYMYFRNRHQKLFKSLDEKPPYLH